MGQTLPRRRFAAFLGAGLAGFAGCTEPGGGEDGGGEDGGGEEGDSEEGGGAYGAVNRPGG